MTSLFRKQVTYLYNWSLYQPHHCSSLMFNKHFIIQVLSVPHILFPIYVMFKIIIYCLQFIQNSQLLFVKLVVKLFFDLYLFFQAMHLFTCPNSHLVSVLQFPFIFTLDNFLSTQGMEFHTYRIHCRLSFPAHTRTTVAYMFDFYYIIFIYIVILAVVSPIKHHVQASLQRIDFYFVWNTVALDHSFRQQLIL